MKIENSKNIISIKFDGFLSCLYIKKPRICDWPDHGGSVARYFACLPFNKWDKEMQDEIENRVSNVNSIEELKSSRFLELLENGEYEFEIWREKETQLLYNVQLYNTNEIVKLWHKREIGDSRFAKPYGLNGFYPYGRQLMFTQPIETLDLERVQYYEQKIKKGERPLAISIRVKRANQDDEETYQENDFNTTKYVLDGHHKLVAYKNLNIKPSYIVINRLQSKSGDAHDESALPYLKPYLLQSQIENIITNGAGYMNPSQDLTKFIDDYISNTNRISDTYIRSLVNNSTLSSFQKSEERRNWFRERLEHLKSKVNNHKGQFNLDYYCQKKYFRKFPQVKSWEEIEQILKNNYS